MQKIKSLFKHGSNGQVYDEIVPGSEWVLNGEGVATPKIDGLCCRVSKGKIYRHDGQGGWLIVGNESKDRHLREAFRKVCWGDEDDGTYELIGPKIQANPYSASEYYLLKHKGRLISDISFVPLPLDCEGIKRWLTIHSLIEGIVWHHPDGRMVKIKRSDFGLEWPIKTGGKLK